MKHKLSGITYIMLLWATQTIIYLVNMQIKNKVLFSIEKNSLNILLYQERQGTEYIE